ncbi:hypothetical protein M529_18650 [Sphingobium ummariense RL-3]|uniref:Integrase n=1 Tax=Sphingobium ummariense RL-3 TaxID=1346791 RepID=T0IPK6_9SPHN|nr:hypothetical protein M529_18650 [Sphingobium ummariense RL-3]
MEMLETELTAAKRPVWNAGRTVGAKRALKPKQIWEIRFYLNQRRRLRDRALFDLAIDSKLRGCDLVQMKIGDLVSGGQIRTRAIVMQQKTGRPVQSNCCRMLERACWHGSNAGAARWMIMFSQAGLITMGT